MRTESTSILYLDGNAFLGCATDRFVHPTITILSIRDCHSLQKLTEYLLACPNTHCYFQRCLPGYTWGENCKPLVLSKRKRIISCTRVDTLNRGLVHRSLPAGTQLQTSLKIREGDTDCFDTEQVISSPRLARCTSSRENNAYQCRMFFYTAHSVHIQNVNQSIFILWILSISTGCSWGPHSHGDLCSFK